MGCWGAAEEGCQESANGRGSTETTLGCGNCRGSLCLNYCVMAGGCFSGLRISACHLGDLGQIFFVLPKFHF